MLCFRLLYAIVLSSDVFDARASACMYVYVVHWHCTAQLSMFNMEKRFRNKIIIIISNFKFGTPVATLPGAWRIRVSGGTGQPGVSVMRLGEVESFICSFYLSVAARTIV